MKRLFDILGLFREYILLATLVLISLFLLAMNDTPQIGAIRSLTVAAVGMIQDTFGFIPDYFDLKEENTILRELNLTLSDEASRLREAKLENIRLRKLLEFKEQSPNRYVSAKVVGKSLQLLRNTITVDAGEDNGVRQSMPIVTDAGLVGKVIATSNRYAVGQILLNIDLRVSARVQRGRVDGIVMWEGGDHLSLKNIAKTLDVQEGDVVITSEHSSMFPPGIRIGVVSKTSQSPGSLFQFVEIQPAVDFSRLEETFILIHAVDSSRLALEQSVQR